MQAEKKKGRREEGGRKGKVGGFRYWWVWRWTFHGSYCFFASVFIVMHLRVMMERRGYGFERRGENVK